MRIGPHDYVPPPEPGLPFWAIAAIVIGGLVAFALWAAMLRRSHARNLGRPADD